MLNLIKVSAVASHIFKQNTNYCLVILPSKRRVPAFCSRRTAVQCFHDNYASVIFNATPIAACEGVTIFFEVHMLATCGWSMTQYTQRSEDLGILVEFRGHFAILSCTDLQQIGGFANITPDSHKSEEELAEKLRNPYGYQTHAETESLSGLAVHGDELFVASEPADFRGFSRTPRINVFTRDGTFLRRLELPVSGVMAAQSAEHGPILVTFCSDHVCTYIVQARRHCAAQDTFCFYTIRCHGIRQSHLCRHTGGRLSGRCAALHVRHKEGV